MNLTMFFGTTDKKPVINKEEVESFVWVDVNNLISDIKTNPNKYTSWFKIGME